MNNHLYRLLSGLYWRGDDCFETALSRVLRPARRLIAREQATAGPFRTSLRRRLWLFRHGFLSRDDVLYDLDGTNHRRYLSEYQRELTRSLNGRWKGALDNKLHFHRLLEPFDACRPAVYAYLKRGRFIPVDDPTETHESTPNDGTRVRDRLDTEERLVVKPTYGTTGSRILVCSKEEERYRINGEVETATALEERVADLDEYLVCEFVEQAPYADGLYPASVNTLRLVTMWDPKTGEPFVTFATHRIGTDRSAPVDNWARGGLSVEIDLATGDLGPGIPYPDDGSLERHPVHPDTGARIEGVAVTDWPAVRDGVLAIAGSYPQIPYVGWDVVVTGAGEFAVIEANSCTDVGIQVHRPLLDDPRARRFYEHYDIVPTEGSGRVGAKSVRPW